MEPVRRARRTGFSCLPVALFLGRVIDDLRFGLQRNLAVDGKIDTQPRYMSNLTIAGTWHNEKRAEGVGFEPTLACARPVFKTGAIGHSATPPSKKDEG